MKNFVKYLLITAIFIQNLLAAGVENTFKSWRDDLGNQVIGTNPNIV